MSKLNIDQQTIKALFSDKKTNFLIPDYQRPYAWGEKECQTLWDDLFTFAFPDNNCDRFDPDNDEYFLGPIVMFKNEGKLEIIDGQQRLTTLMLLLRAFYAKFGSMEDEKALKTSKYIEQCIWKTDEIGDADKNVLKINSEVATEKEKTQFLAILKTGKTDNDDNSNYAKNYRFFQERISNFQEHYSSYFTLFPLRIMNNCILLPIEAESQDTALRIFSTLNDRGKPLSDSDIFKAQFYKFYSSHGKKDEFISRWQDLEALCESIFHPKSGTPMDEIFTRYMYFERAKQGIASNTTEALRKFYERNAYALLKKDETFDNLIDLARFWDDIEKQNDERFSDRVLRRLFVLRYAPNGMWTYFVSVYYMANRNASGILEDEQFFTFLDKTIAFIWAYAVTHPGVNALRTPLFSEMINLVHGRPVSFSEFLFDAPQVQNFFDNYVFSNNRAITKSMMTWWAFQNPNQELLHSTEVLEIEHIYPRNRQEKEHTLSNAQNVESLGNKSLLEKRINISASDYKFEDKVKYYKGFEIRKKKKEGTKIQELLNMATHRSDFTESDIVQRKARIIQTFIDFMRSNKLLKDC